MFGDFGLYTTFSKPLVVDATGNAQTTITASKRTPQTREGVVLGYPSPVYVLPIHVRGLTVGWELKWCRCWRCERPPRLPIISDRRRREESATTVKTKALATFRVTDRQWSSTWLVDVHRHRRRCQRWWWQWRQGGGTAGCRLLVSIREEDDGCRTDAE